MALPTDRNPLASGGGDGRRRSPSPKRSDKGAPPKRAPRRSSDDQDFGPVVKGSRPDVWRVDPKTGVRYRELPRTDWTSLSKDGKSGGMSVSHLSDTDMLSAFDGTSMDLAAKQFLGHLQVPVSKQELEEIRKEKARLLREQNEALRDLRAQERLRDEQEAERAAAVAARLDQELAKPRKRPSGR